jgi:hypothetical protein
MKSPKAEDMKVKDNSWPKNKPSGQFAFKPKKISVKGLKSKPKTSKKQKAGKVSGKGLLGKAMKKINKRTASK